MAASKLAIALVASSCGTLIAGPPPVEFRTAAEIRRLAVEEAERGHPVHLRGVVTFFDQKTPTKAYRFIQDDTAGIYFYLATNTQDPGLKAGQSIELDGHTGKGEFAPIVVAERIRILGPGIFPTAKPVALEELVSGREDSQFVEVHGVVRAVRLEDQRLYFQFEVATGEGRLTAYTTELPVPRSEDLVDCTVRVRGVCFTQFNRQRQLFDFGLLVPRPEDLAVEKSAPKDPFEMAAQPIKSLLQYSAQGAYGHRLKIVGTVILRYPDRLYLQNGVDGVCVETKQSGNVSVGDRVEALGFPTKGEYAPMIRSAIYRKIKPEPQPVPARITADTALKGDYDCRLVSIEATLLDRAQHSQEPFLVLQAEGFIFHAYLKEQGASLDWARLENGSKVRLTGVCVIEAGEDWHYGEDWRAASFRLLLRSPADIVVMQSPPFWTLQKLLWAVALLLAIVLGAFAWVAILRRRVQEQTQIIKEKLEGEATLKERYVELFENANDVVFTHDLTGRLTSINRTGERLLGRRREEILSKSLVDLVAEEQRAPARQWLEQVTKGAEMPAEWDFVDSSGHRFKLEINTRRIEQNGKKLEVEAIGRDVTERKRLEREILEISNQEQRRIGHDLHDGVCQQLAAIAYRSHVLARRLQEKGVTEAADAESLGDLINESLVQTRGVARGLFPVRLEENGLISAMEELAANAQSLYTVTCKFSASGHMPEVDNQVALHVYYIAQEAVLNAAKHSRAREVLMILTPSAHHLALTIRDDGAGFTPDDLPREGMGIRIMRYRARVIGATLDLQSQPGHGTQVRCVFQPAPARV